MLRQCKGVKNTSQSLLSAEVVIGTLRAKYLHSQNCYTLASLIAGFYVGPEASDKISNVITVSSLDNIHRNQF